MDEQKLDLNSKDIVSENILKIKELFPKAFVEDKIDFNKLKEELGEFVETCDERYSFIWPDKNKSIKESQKRSSNTLCPNFDKSENWNETKNVYIEGDNLEVLKLLQKSYYNKIKAIYIDPPYNTGNEIIYKNDFKDSIDFYLKRTGQRVVEEGESITIINNTETNGRFHTNWLNEIYPCLKLSRDLLDDDGIIFIAIDDYEIHNLRMIADEIFNGLNFVGTVVTKCNPQGRGKKNLDPVHEYHLIYAKNKDKMPELKVKRDSAESQYQNFMRTGTNSRKFERPNRFYPMLVKDDKVSVITQEEYDKIYDGTKFDDNHLEFINYKYKKLGFKVVYPIAQSGEEKVWQREFSRAAKECSTYIYENGKIKTPKDSFRTPISLWGCEDENLFSNVQYGTNLLLKMFDGKKTFEYPKSIHTVKRMISMVNEGIILDFYAGSSTTAHAVMQLNAEEQKNYSFILVQIPDLIDEDEEAYSIGYRNLCQIGEERIKRAGKLIMEENKNDIDVGFKVFELNSSNFEKWDPNYNDLEESIRSSIYNIKQDRSNYDIIYEILIKEGVDLRLPLKKYQLDKYSIYLIDNMVLCWDENIEEDISGLLLEFIDNNLNNHENIRVVFKDKCFASSLDKIKIKEAFKSSKISKFISV